MKIVQVGKIVISLMVFLAPLSFWSASKVQAFTPCDFTMAAFPDGNCYRSQTLDLGLGDVAYVMVRAKDENGNNIVGANVNYAWSLSDSSVGRFNNPPVLANSTWAGNTNSTLNGYSVARFEVSPTRETVGQFIIINATYGELTRQLRISLSSLCLRDPVLYYGIAGASEYNKNAYQYSTAEVLETCYTEYKLYSPDGKRYQ